MEAKEGVEGDERRGRWRKEGKKKLSSILSLLLPFSLLTQNAQAHLISNPTTCDSALNLRAIRFCCFDVLLKLLKEGAETIFLRGEVNGLRADEHRWS